MEAESASIRTDLALGPDATERGIAPGLHRQGYDGRCGINPAKDGARTATTPRAEFDVEYDERSSAVAVINAKRSCSGAHGGWSLIPGPCVRRSGPAAP